LPDATADAGRVEEHDDSGRDPEYRDQWANKTQHRDREEENDRGDNNHEHRTHRATIVVSHR
jgi:hypothetical protein